MRPRLRFLVGAGLGGGALAAYLAFVGAGEVASRSAAVTTAALAGVVLLVVAEGLVDGVGVWASVHPLGDGLSPGESVQFALAGDFFDTLSPAGPVSSEPIMARFIGVATDTGYSDALGVRSVAKYVKAGAQLGVSTLLAAAVFLGGSSPRYVVVTLGGSVLGLAVVGAVLVAGRSLVSRVAVAVLAPVVQWLSGRYRDDPHGRGAVERAVGRFWERALGFREDVWLLGLVALGGVLEQVLLAAALWTALSGTGTAVALLPVVAVVPLPQVASVVPVPGSIGAYDVLLSGALVVMTAASPAAATAAVLVVRAVSVPFAVAAGGFCVAFLRGWTP